MTALTQDIDRACARIAPTWPLDQFIAVNPYWGWVDQPMPQAAAALEALGGTRLTLPRSWFAAQWQAGHLQRRHLQAAAERA
ncbi:MAG: putative inorganic carbon transporter subunit DabA, partial [Nitrospirota bacterium]